MAAMRCRACRKGTLVPTELHEHDMGAWLGIESVMVESVPALRCDACGAVSFDGAVLDAVTRAFARMLVNEAGDLWPSEARFLRKFLLATQSELAERLQIDRTTIARWETADEPIGRAHSASLRAHVALHLAGLDPSQSGALEQALSHPPKQPMTRGRYVVSDAKYPHVATT